MSELTPAQLAIACALVGDDWETDTELDADARESIADCAREVEATARALIEAEVRKQVEAEILAMPARFGDLTPAYEGVDREAVQPALDMYNMRGLFEAGIEAAYQFAHRRAARIAGGGPSRG